jgi:hypothetical protein
VDQPAQQVATEPVSTQDVERVPGILHAHQLDRHRDDPGQHIGLALGKERHRQPYALVDDESAAQRYRIDLGLVAIDKGPDMPAAVLVLREEMQALWRRIGVAGAVMGGVDRRDELGQQRHQVKQCHHPQAHQRQPVPLEASPHQAELAFANPLGGGRSQRYVHAFDSHHLLP